VSLKMPAPPAPRPSANDADDPPSSGPSVREPFVLSSDREPVLADILARYPNKMAATIPLLHLCQEQHGWVSNEVVAYVADTLEVPTSHVFGVTTFYSLFFTHPMGEHHVWVCRTLSCALNGADAVLERCRERLGIDVGETTPDGRISLHTAECLASCGSGPMMQIDKSYHENLTLERVDVLLDRLRRGRPLASALGDGPTR
ncbi:MAG: NAD(P)H-dependent oxidoreductase subunit E, partial [Myxococcota bacterium]